MIDADNFLRDIESLLKVKVINTTLMAKLEESKVLFKKDIEEHFKEAVKVIPFPTGESIEYPFTLTRSFKNGISKWRARIIDKKVHLPWESILPYDLIDEIGSYPVNSEETVRIKDIKYKRNLFNISFIKYLDDAIVGIIQKIKDSSGSGDKPDVSTLDMCQYLDLPDEEQVDIFLQYFKTYAEIRKKVLFNFFTNILPDTEIMRELI
ncbi:MAG: hypothetical protein JSV88_12755 [Candidatus Aminicenantes bacterium]|nr:MAG: hypothetical protein JSV88_12755 [Candidatus Aminicenantes bacterium]